MTSKTLPLSLCLAAALALGGLGCAHVRGATSTSPTVSDEQLARVPPQQMGNVNQARLISAQAKDEVARRQLEVQKAQNEMDAANQSLKVANAEYDLATQQAKNSEYARDATAHTRAQGDISRAEAKRRAAQSHIDFARAQGELAKARLNRANQQATYGDANLDWEKFQALSRSGDPSAASINSAAIQQRVLDAKNAVAQSDSQIQLSKGDVESARERYRADQERADSGRGIGGSGANVGSSKVNERLLPPREPVNTPQPNTPAQGPTPHVEPQPRRAPSSDSGD